MTRSDVAAFAARHEPRGRALAIGAASIAVGAVWIRLALNPAGDLQNHRTFALRLLSGGDPYAGGLDVPYTPFWALAHAPAAWMPARLMPALVFPVGLAAIAAILHVLSRLPHRDSPTPAAAFWVSAATLAITSRFVLRDLFDAGQNACVLAIAWAGLYAWTRGRATQAGLLVGLAAALKLTPLVFCAYFALKREWRTAAVALAAACAFTLAPALWLGPQPYTQAMRSWSAGIARGVASGDLRRGVLGEEPIENQSLRAAIGRAWPAAGAHEAWIALAVGLSAAAAWRLRHRLAGPDDPAFAIECAAIGVLALLLSPITWRSHGVAIVPACYLLARDAAVARRTSALALAAAGGLIVVSLGFNRAIAGSAASDVAHEYSLFTWTFLLVFAAALDLRRRTATPERTSPWPAAVS